MTSYQGHLGRIRQSVPLLAIGPAGITGHTSDGIGLFPKYSL
jgi:hypothetical protein